ncbi:MAG: hypothetical protein ACREUQ_02380 [Burkholderiales bacterium]
MNAPLHIAFYNHSKLIKDTDCAFQVEAIGEQLREHAAPFWGDPPPGCTFFGSVPKVPPGQAAILGYVDDDGNADSAGYHSEIGGLVYGLIDCGQSDVPSETASHEGAEMYGNQHLTRKVSGPNKLLYFVELGDPLQGRAYTIKVVLFGEERHIVMADFCLPAWFGLPNADGSSHRTYLGAIGAEYDPKPFEIMPGGYQIAETATGKIQFLSSSGFSMRPSKHTRTHRILQAARKQTA